MCACLVSAGMGVQLGVTRHAREGLRGCVLARGGEQVAARPQHELVVPLHPVWSASKGLGVSLPAPLVCGAASLIVCVL